MFQHIVIIDKNTESLYSSHRKVEQELLIEAKMNKLKMCVCVWWLTEILQKLKNV